MNRIVLTVFLSITTIFSSASTQVLPLGELETNFIYDYLERVEALTLDNFRYQLAPYTMDNPNFKFGPLSYLAEIPQGEINLFSFAAADMKAANQNRARSFESVRIGFSGRPSEKVFLYGSATLDEARAKDPNYRGKKWRGLAGDVDFAFINFRTKNFELTSGRFASSWGPRNSLVLSGDNKLDGVAYTYHWGKISISYRLASLDGLSPQNDSVAQFENRYFAGHRFDFHFSPRLRIGLFETVVFGGPGRQIEFGYLNPFVFFHGSQLNQGANDNTFLGLDFTIKPGTGNKLYGQLLIDDFQIDNSNQGDQEPAEIGLLIGGYLANLVSQIDMSFEYTRVTNRTYNQILVRNKYVYNGRPLAAVRGNDYDESSLSLYRWFGSGMKAQLGLSYYRQGEGKIGDQFTTPWSDVQGDYFEPFPTGIVQKSTTATMGVSGFLGKVMFVDLEGGVVWTRNAANLLDNNSTLPFVSLKISSHFSTPFKIQ